MRQGMQNCLFMQQKPRFEKVRNHNIQERSEKQNERMMLFYSTNLELASSLLYKMGSGTCC